MRIFLNNQALDILKEESLKEVLLHQNIPCQGTALALNNQVIAKDLWASTYLSEGDKLMVIRASCGG
ncbi:MAG: sulfur carrier protein ThiS [Bacteroidales bacterium]